MRSASRVQTGARRVPRTAFRPGVSGNPSGRPKRTVEEFQLIQACREKAPTALVEIERLMRSAVKDSTRLAAAIFIIERGYGKAGGMPPEKERSPLEQISTELLLAMRDELVQRREAKCLQASVVSEARSSPRLLTG